MQKYSLKYNVKPFERLFIDKSIESLYSNTIDSYRLKLHNPKSILTELINVVNDSTNGVLTNNDYLNATSKEIKKLLNTNNDALIFKKINKDHFLSNLEKPNKATYKILQQSAKLILKNNTNYLKTLIFEINSILDSHFIFYKWNGKIRENKEKDLHEIQKKLIVLTDYLYIELINKGFSKQYLYRTFQSIFIYCNENTNFDHQLNVFYKIIQKEDEKYTVIFSINESSFNFSEFRKIDDSYIQVNKRFKKIHQEIISNDAKEFLLQKNNLVAIEFYTKDYFKAVQYGIDKISKDLDIYHLGYNRKYYKVEQKCLTIGESDPAKSSVIPSNYQIDGFFKSNAYVFNNLLQKIHKLKNCNIDDDSFQKILSAIRYFRTGSESPELENKFLNYWIGLEFIFNSYNSDEKTIDRIRKYFTKCHSLIYIKRNLFDFHQTLKRLEIDQYIPDYNDDLNYLLNHKSYKIVIEKSNYELIKYRAYYFQKWFEEPNKISEVLTIHNNNVEWNITRLYRIRNEIVHNAAIKNNITTHISHLKYYLSFILNSILDFMADNDVDLDNDGKITIDDFFISQDIILGCLNKSKLEEWLKIDNANQIFQ